MVCHEQNMSKIYIAMDVVTSFAVTKPPVCPAQRVQTMGWILGEKLQKERTMLYTLCLTGICCCEFFLLENTTSEEDFGRENVCGSTKGKSATRQRILLSVSGKTMRDRLQ